MRLQSLKANKEDVIIQVSICRVAFMTQHTIVSFLEVVSALSYGISCWI